MSFISCTSDDPQIAEPTRDFLRDATYVDDEATSSQDMETIKLIAGELGPLYEKYSFKMKHCLKNYSPCKGKTTDEFHEEILGLQWNFQQDTLRPHLDIYLTSKKRGLYTDSKLSLEGIKTAIITQRLLLRVVGQCYDLSGRSICPVIMAGRLMYGSIC